MTAQEQPEPIHYVTSMTEFWEDALSDHPKRDAQVFVSREDVQMVRALLDLLSAERAEHDSAVRQFQSAERDVQQITAILNAEREMWARNGQAFAALRAEIQQIEQEMRRDVSHSGNVVIEGWADRLARVGADA